MENYTTTSIEEILNSQKFTVIKQGANATYESPSFYLKNLLDKFEKLNVKLTGFGSHPTQVGEKDSENILTAYGRVGIVATLLEHGEDKEKLSYNVGFMYSVEGTKAFIKIFRGFNIHICSNMCIFGSDDIRKLDFSTENIDILTEEVIKYIDEAEEKFNLYLRIKQAMQNTRLTHDEVLKFYGRLVFNLTAPNVKNLVGLTIKDNSARLLQNPNSYYFYESFTTAWNVYNALTDGYRDKTHIIDQPEKVLAVYREMLNYCKEEKNTNFNNAQIMQEEIQLLN